jgi:hypothetical protein
MYATYHLKSAEEINTDILDAIKAAFKSKPITIIIEEDIDAVALTEEMEKILDQRLQEDEETYITGNASIEQLKKKYGI